MSKLLTVFGATGSQGGSVIASVLADPALSKEFKLRGITRDTSKPAAQKLTSQGVEMVTADLNDEKSLEKAVHGSYAIFTVTNFWETMSEETEVKQGKAMADAAKAQGVKLIVWSTLKNVTKLSGGKLTKVSHFDGKAKIADYIESIKGSSLAAAYFMPGFYMGNLKSDVHKTEDGKPALINVWDGSTSQVPLFDPHKDTGTYVAAILKQPLDKANGLHVHAVSQWLTPDEIVKTYSQVSGKQVAYKKIPSEVYCQNLPMPNPIAIELTENMELIRDFGYYGPGEEKNQAKHDAILQGAKTESWADFVKRNQDWDV